MATIAKMAVALGLDSKGYDKGLKGAMGRTAGFAKAVGKTLAIGIGVGVTAMAGFGIMAAKQAMKAEELEGAYHRMTKKMGYDSTVLLKKLRKSSKGTISDLDLISTANRAMALGVGESMDDMSTLLEIARLKGKAFGLSTTQAFGDIVTGLGRASPMILDNLGITIKLSEAHAQYARALGKDVKALTEAEKKAALFNAVMREGRTQLKAAGDVGLSTAERFQKLRARFSNITVAIGRRLLPIVNRALDLFEDWGIQLQAMWQTHGPRIASTLASMRRKVEELWTKILPLAKGVSKKLIPALTNLVEIARSFPDRAQGLKQFFDANTTAANLLKGAILGVTVALTVSLIPAIAAAVKATAGVAAAAAIAAGGWLAVVAVAAAVGAALWTLYQQWEPLQTFIDEIVVPGFLRFHKAVGTARGGVGEAIGRLIPQIGELAGAFGRAIEQIITGAISTARFVGNAFGYVGRAIMALSKATMNLRAIIVGVMRMIGTIIGRTMGDIMGAFGGLIGFIAGEFIPALWRHLGIDVPGILRNLWQSIGDWLGQIGDAIGSKGKEWGEALAATWGRIEADFEAYWGRIVQAFKDRVNLMIGLINGMIGAVDRFFDLLRLLPGGEVSVPHISRMPKMGTGGTILRGGMGIVGDRGPEAVWLPRGATVAPLRQTELTGPTVGPIEVGVNLTPDLEDIRGQVLKAVMEATDDALRRAGFRGSFVTSGAFTPS